MIDPILRDPRCQPYTFLVRYRTKSGCNAKVVHVSGSSREHAEAQAINHVKNMRGVIAIDSTTAWDNDPNSNW